MLIKHIRYRVGLVFVACFEQFEIISIIGGMTNLILILVLAGLLICLLCTGCRVLPWG